MNKEINLIELFSGIGGFALGLQRAGFNIKRHQFSEVDKNAIGNYKYNFRNAEHIGSVTDFQGKRGQADVITFGSPCQDFSIAGKRAGLEGEKSSLIQEAIRIIDKVRPVIFIWENVKGAFSSNAGADFWAIIKRFADLRDYRLEWQLVNTSWLLPQNRERIILIGHHRNGSKPKVFPISENDRLSAFTNRRRLQTKNSSTTLKASGAVKADETFISTCLTASSSKITASDTFIEMSITPVLTPDRKEKRQNGRRFKDVGDPSFTLTAQDNHGVLIEKVATKGNSQGQRLYDPQGLACTLSSEGGGLGAKTGLYEIEKKIRRLTEIECERIQGFPDNWTKYGLFDGKKKEISMTQRYKMLGNAVTADIIEVVGKKLIK